jgi:hypothetical protein
LEGTYDLHCWYFEGEKTYIFKKPVNFCELNPVELFSDGEFTKEEVVFTIQQQPKCCKPTLIADGGKALIRIEIEQVIAVAVYGETKLAVYFMPWEYYRGEEIIGEELRAPEPVGSNPEQSDAGVALMGSDLPEDEEEDS